MADRFEDRLRMQFIPGALNRLGEFSIKGSHPALLAARKFAPLVHIKPEGVPAYAQLLNDVAAKSPLVLSSYGGTLEGYRINTPGLDDLADIPETGALLVTNTAGEIGPLNVFWSPVLISSRIKQATGQEVTWLLPYGNPYKGYNAFIGGVYCLVQQNIGGIIVGGPNEETSYKTKVAIFDALHHKRVVGVFMEKEPSDKLTKADEEAGHLIAMAAERGIPTIAASVWKEDDTLNFVHKIINPQSIVGLMRVFRRARNMEQVVADGVMSEISSGLPEQFRGEYSFKTH